jgi:hypothetical protein
MTTMHLTANVEPGGKVELTLPGALSGQSVDVYVVVSDPATAPRQGVMDFLRALPPGPRSAPSWIELDKQLEQERNAWDR